MAFDGIITHAIVKELRDTVLMGKIEKVYQPESEQLILHIHTPSGNVRLLLSVESSHASVNFIETNPTNPLVPFAFCMLLRKHIQGGRIVDISQKEGERIIEISLETLNELGFTMSKKLIVEIMGKHSNISLVDMGSGKIIDSIKRISLDVNRVRQLLPGMEYRYPPAQDKIPFNRITKDQMDAIPHEEKAMLSHIGGISPAVAAELANADDSFDRLKQILDSINQWQCQPCVYVDNKDMPKEYHITELSAYADRCQCLYFSKVSQAIDYFFDHKQTTNRIHQKSYQLSKNITAVLDKLYLKKQRLNEDLLKAENSEDLRLFGELLTANMHMVKTGQASVTVTNYYDDSPVTIPLDQRFSPAKNAQIYFKRYGKSKTAIKEKQLQLHDNQQDIDYLESILTYLTNAKTIDEIDGIRSELVETGYVRPRKNIARKPKKSKLKPLQATTSDGFTVFIGRNNKENDQLTLKTAEKTDIWLHTKDIPGSHVILRTGGMQPTKTAIYEAAAMAAWHSKGRDSENVAVDYVPARYVKKPAGAKPGMVIFTHNHTVWVNPKEPSN